MKSVIIIALLAITVSASLKTNSCFMDKAGVTLADMSKLAKSVEMNLNTMEAVISKLATIKAAYAECDNSEMKAASLDAILNNLGVGNMLISQCSKDLGGYFLILDSIVEDPKDITNDIFGLIFSSLMGKQAYADCGQLIAFLQSLRH